MIKQFFINPYIFEPPRLLDTYSGAAAAYSLRRLNTAYTGPVLQVRRSGDSAEDTFSADEVGDGTLAAWVTAGGGTEDGFVKTWYDQSGNGNDASQATLANQPQIVASGAVVLEGSNSTLQFASDYLKLANPPLTSAAAFSVFASFNMQNANLYEMIFSQSDGTSNLYRFEIRRNATSNSLEYLASFATSINGISAINNTHVLLSFLGSGKTATSYISGTLDGTRTDSNNIAINNYDSYIGIRNNSQYPLNGTLQELIVYTSDQSSNRTGIESNIATHYGITLS